MNFFFFFFFFFFKFIYDNFTYFPPIYHNGLLSANNYNIFDKALEHTEYTSKLKYLNTNSQNTVFRKHYNQVEESRFRSFTHNSYVIPENIFLSLHKGAFLAFAWKSKHQK